MALCTKQVLTHLELIFQWRRFFFSPTLWMGRLSLQFSSVAQSCPTLCDPMNCSMPGFPVHHQLLEPTQPMSIELVMPSSHLILCRPLFLLPSIFPSIRSFQMSQLFASGGQILEWFKSWQTSHSWEVAGPVLESVLNEHTIPLLRPHTLKKGYSPQAKAPGFSAASDPQISDIKKPS